MRLRHARAEDLREYRRLAAIRGIAMTQGLGWSRSGWRSWSGSPRGRFEILGAGAIETDFALALTGPAVVRSEVLET